MDYYRQYRRLVKAVTTEDVLETAKRYLDVNRLVVATAGPSADEDNQVAM